MVQEQVRCRRRVGWLRRKFVAGALGVDDARAIYICNKLDELRRAGSTCAKELLEIAGYLIWITGLWDLLRPLVQPFYAAAYGMRRRSRYKPPALIRFACKYFVSQISTAPRRVAAKQRQLLNIWAASDGSASPPTPSAGSSATVGGWFGPVGCSKSEVTWFSEPLEKKDAPWLYSRGENAQRSVSSVEMMGTMMLVKAILESSRGCNVSVSVPAVADKGNSFILAKCYTASWPGAAILAEIASTLLQRDAEARIGFLPREQNQWADDLSKGEFGGFCKDRRLVVPWRKPEYYNLLPDLLRRSADFSTSDTDAPAESATGVPTRAYLRATPSVADADVYIGRGTLTLPRSPWANPVSVRAAGSAAAAVECYRSHLRESEELQRLLPSLSGKRLVCHCAPAQPCHADAIIEDFVRQFASMQ